MVVPIRDGTSVCSYGYAQTSLFWLDLEALDMQRAERFVDPMRCIAP